jgi:hypothetical protein
MSGDALDRMPTAQIVISVLWPSFLTAIVASGLFFSAFDPVDLVPFNLDFAVSPLAAYSIGFLLFWLIAAISSFGSVYLAIVNCRSLNQSDH